MIEELPETFWAYLAGLIDGEGHISIYQAGPQLNVTNTDVETLEWIQDSLGFGYLNKLGMCSGRVRQAYKWGCYSGGLKLVLPKVIPYMRIKKDRAELALRYVMETNWSPGRKRSEEEILRRNGVRDELKRLNRRTYSRRP